jgi:thioredoxin-like negative regulator of GroEL
MAGSIPALAETLAGWSTNLDAALKEAPSKDQPVLAYFTASWCGPCRLLAKTTFKDETVLQALDSFQRVLLDVDVHSTLAEQRGIRAVPTFQIFTPDGQVILTLTGYQDARNFTDWLTNGLAQVRRSLAEQRRSAAALADARKLLQSPDQDSLKRAASILFDLCSTQETNQLAAAVQALTQLGTAHPLLLLDGLNHPRLATRIQAANLLRARLGEAFDVDPWADEQARLAALTRWRERLSVSNPK